MPTLSKRRKANEALKPQGLQSAEEAVRILKSFKPTKFDQTVEVCMHLGIDPKQADQQLRGAVSLPHGVGKTARVVAFCQQDKIEACKANGAIEAGGEDLVEKIKGGWMEFDVAVASPDMMRLVSQLGKTLGPKGLMPSPKAGTVTPNVAQAVKEYAAGKVEYRNDDGGNIHCVIGKLSFEAPKLVDNFNHFYTVIEKSKPSTTKGQYVKKITISGTMTPGIQITPRVTQEVAS
jgi:large subunit ribosomal protein L1